MKIGSVVLVLWRRVRGRRGPLRVGFEDHPAGARYVLEGPVPHPSQVALYVAVDEIEGGPARTLQWPLHAQNFTARLDGVPVSLRITLPPSAHPERELRVQLQVRPYLPQGAWPGSDAPEDRERDEIGEDLQDLAEGFRLDERQETITGVSP